MEQKKRKFNKGKRGNKHGKTNWADRRRRKRQRNEGNNNREEYEKKPIVMDSTKFDLYYRKVLDPILNSGNATEEADIIKNKDEDFKQFLALLKQKLPITFRVNPSCTGFESVTSLIGSDTFIQDW